MRARSIKPGLFKNELLAVADPLYTLIFEGLWLLADREGRLEDRPARIHLEVNPGRAFTGTVEALSWLHDNGFILRYVVAGAPYIQIVMFSRHQKPHQNEKPSEIPRPDLGPRQQALDTKAASEVDQGDKHLALNPSSLNPSSLNPDSGVLTPHSLTADATASGTHAASPVVPDDGRGRRAVSSKRGTRIAIPFPVTAEMREWAARETPNVDVTTATAEFEDFWRGVPGAKGCKVDWIATWRNRLRELQGRSRLNGSHAAPRKTRYEQFTERLRAGEEGDIGDPLG